MATELAIRFTEEKYLTKNEVIKELRMTLVDSIWSNVLSYRNEFNHYLRIRSIERNQYYLCLCNNVKGLINRLSKKEARFLQESNFIPHSSEEKVFKDYYLNKCYQSIAKKNGINVSSSVINAFINGENLTMNVENKIIVNYDAALKYALNYAGDIDENFLGNLYSRILGVKELDSFYRYRDEISNANKVLIDRVYTSAPSSLVESMMNSLFDFLDNETLDKYALAASILYYFDYVKPFDSYNEELAILLAKSLLAKEIGELAFYLPLESIIADYPKELIKVYIDSQKTNDITYSEIFIFTKIIEIYDLVVDYAIKLKTNGIKKDFYQSDEPKDEVIKQEPPEVKPVIKEVVKEPVINPEPPEVRIIPVKKDVPQKKIDEDIRAFVYVPSKYDEREILRMANRLLEIDPLLSKKEAKFYAGHCTLGRMYSISQFKKEIGCVYETARTSMEHLAMLGYYKKEQIKNKFFYTPVDRK